MAIAAPTQLATISNNTAASTSWSTGAIVFPTTSTPVLGLMTLALSGYTATLGLAVSDNLGNTWTVISGATAESTAGSARITTAIAYFLYPSAAGSTTATVTASFNSLNERMGWCGYTTGHDTTTPVDQSGIASTSTAVSTITAAVSAADTAAGDLSIVAMGLTAGANLTVTWPSSSGASYTSLANNADTTRHRNGAFEYQILGAAGTESTTITYSGNASSVASIATFKASSGGTNATVTAPAGALTLGAAAPLPQENIPAPAGQLTLGAATAAIKDDVPIPAGQLTLGAVAGAVKEDIPIAVGQLTLGAVAPVVTYSGSLFTTAGLITLSGGTNTVSGTSAPRVLFISSPAPAILYLMGMDTPFA